MLAEVLTAIALSTGALGASDGWANYVAWEPIPEVALLVECESGGNPVAQNPTSSASGRYQFISSTWAWVTGAPPPAGAYPVWRQQEAFEKLWDDGRGASHWVCKVDGSTR